MVSLFSISVFFEPSPSLLARAVSEKATFHSLISLNVTVEVTTVLGVANLIGTVTFWGISGTAKWRETTAECAGKPDKTFFASLKISCSLRKKKSESRLWIRRRHVVVWSTSLWVLPCHDPSSDHLVHGEPERVNSLWRVFGLSFNK